MKKFKLIFFFMLALTMFTNGFADDFQKDRKLIRQLKEKNIKLIVVRQGESGNNTDVIISSSNSPGYYLTSNGVQEVIDLENKLKKEKIQKIYTSPLYRCMQVTQMFGIWFELPHENLIVDDHLIIQNFGNYEGMHYRDYEKLFCSKKEMLEANLKSAESGFSVYQRSLCFLWDLADKHSNETILIVTHAFNCCHIKKCLTGYFGEIPAPAEYAIYDFRD